MKRRGPPRTLVAAVLLAAALAALLLAWFYAGWAEVRARQQVTRAAPIEAASDRAAELAHELRVELSGLMAREVDRPYFQYQNLMHDPLSTAGVNVVPSPLAAGPTEPLVLGYFQLDSKGKATTPTINDDVPELNERTQLAGNLRFRDEVTRSLSTKLAPSPQPGPPVTVATADPPKAPKKTTKPASQAVTVTSVAATDALEAERKNLEGQTAARDGEGVKAGQVNQNVAMAKGQTKGKKLQSRVITIDRGSYTQNNMSNSIYQDNLPAIGGSVDGKQIEGAQTNENDNGTGNDNANETVQAEGGTTEVASAGPGQQAVPRQATIPRQQTVKRVAPPPLVAAKDPVTITVSPLEWHTQTFSGQPTLVAVREVTTPDGNFAQGFVVDRATLTRWLAERAGDTVVELATGDDASAELAPGWHLTGSPNPRAIAEAAAAAAKLARTFILRFVVIGLIAALAGALVVMLVARAERLARERSQFAAAAAHELRTPLAGLQLYGDMLADGLGDQSKQRDYARRMSEEAARLGRVVSNVLGFSQLERGNLSVEPSVARLDEELRQLAQRAEPALDRAGAMVSLEVEPELRAKFDRDALARIVGNLLDNAEKYSRDAEDRTITLGARAAGDIVEIIVSDHGPGIAAATRARLFRAFSRGVPADGPAGLGLGLALSQSLARAMGGDLEHRPTQAGATFVLRLPAA